MVYALGMKGEARKPQDNRIKVSRRHAGETLSEEGPPSLVCAR